MPSGHGIEIGGVLGPRHARLCRKAQAEVAQPPLDIAPFYTPSAHIANTTINPPALFVTTIVDVDVYSCSLAAPFCLLASLKPEATTTATPPPRASALAVVLLASALLPEPFRRRPPWPWPGCWLLSSRLSKRRQRAWPTLGLAVVESSFLFSSSPPPA